jgi:hypothetical protein
MKLSAIRHCTALSADPSMLRRLLSPQSMRAPYTQSRPAIHLFRNIWFANPTLAGNRLQPRGKCIIRPETKDGSRETALCRRKFQSQYPNRP